jgi:hypothetical protein
MGFYHQTPGALSVSDRNCRDNVLLTLDPYGSSFSDVAGALKQFIVAVPVRLQLVIHWRYASTAGELWIQNATWNSYNNRTNPLAIEDARYSGSVWRPERSNR